MRTSTEQAVSMRANTDITLLQLATSFVEQAALCMGLGRAEALALTLATEEIFSYLCKVSPPDQDLEIRCVKGGYYVRTDFSFSIKDFKHKVPKDPNNPTENEKKQIEKEKDFKSSLSFKVTDGVNPIQDEAKQYFLEFEKML